METVFFARIDSGFDFGNILPHRGADVARCDRLLHRADALIEDWQLAQLHPNISAQYFYQAALTCMELQRPERALPYLRRFADTVAALLRGAPILHGDAFFDRLEPWIARMELGGDAPRRLRLAAQDAGPGPAAPGVCPAARGRGLCHSWRKSAGGSQPC